MNYKEQAGINKKSFELNYHGGTIWCEHLDSMGKLEQEVIDKFTEDCKSFCRPSVSSYMIINLDETVITENIAQCIIDGIKESGKQFRKIVFVGVDKIRQKQFAVIQLDTGAILSFKNDYEKAKEWLFLGD